MFQKMSLKDICERALGNTFTNLLPLKTIDNKMRIRIWEERFRNICCNHTVYYAMWENTADIYYFPPEFISANLVLKGDPVDLFNLGMWEWWYPIHGMPRNGSLSEAYCITRFMHTVRRYHFDIYFWRIEEEKHANSINNAETFADWKPWSELRATQPYLLDALLDFRLVNPPTRFTQECFFFIFLYT